MSSAPKSQLFTDTDALCKKSNVTEQISGYFAPTKLAIAFKFIPFLFTCKLATFFAFVCRVIIKKLELQHRLNLMF